MENDPPPVENESHPSSEISHAPPVEIMGLTPPMENDKLIRIDPLSGNKE